MTNGVQGILCECILGSRPMKDSEAFFHWIVQKTATTGSSTGNCQLVVQLASVAHMRLSIKCLNTNTSEPLKLFVSTVVRPTFSYNFDHKVIFSSKKNDQNKILTLLQGNRRMPSRIIWPSCVAEVDHAGVRIPSWGNEGGRNIKNHHVCGIS